MGTSWWPLFLIIGSNLIYQSSSRCASKDTAVKLLLDTRDPAFASFG